MRFQYHNILLPDGTQTNPDAGYFVGDGPWMQGALRLLRRIYGQDLRGKTVSDIGALEGGYSIEFAKAGMQVLGLEIRKANFENCELLRGAFGLPNLSFVMDDCWNLERYGRFDALFCSGLLYHLDRPKAFIDLLGKVAKDVVFLQTHFAPEVSSETFTLSDLTLHEGVEGRWYHEHDSDDPDEIESYKLSSFHNKNSFWLTRPSILQSLRAAGFDIVLEQYDALGDDIIGSMSNGYYSKQHRSMFVGIRS